MIQKHYADFELLLKQYKLKKDLFVNDLYIKNHGQVQLITHGK